MSEARGRRGRRDPARMDAGLDNLLFSVAFERRGLLSGMDTWWRGRFQVGVVLSICS